MRNRFFKHYKGHIYEVLHLFMHSETMETMVLYRAIDGDRECWGRPLYMWNDVINEETGQKRFETIDLDGDVPETIFRLCLVMHKDYSPQAVWLPLDLALVGKKITILVNGVENGRWKVKYVFSDVLVDKDFYEENLVHEVFDNAIEFFGEV